MMMIIIMKKRKNIRVLRSGEFYDKTSGLWGQNLEYHKGHLPWWWRYISGTGVI